MSSMHHRLSGWIASIVSIVSITLFTCVLKAEFTSEISLNIQSRIFMQTASEVEQHESVVSFATNPSFNYEFESGSTILVEPFFRGDSGDNNRTHFDMREASFTYPGEIFEISIGIKKIFWGVTEFLNIVDIINQKDIVEELMGNEKLGQPMTALSLFTPFGKFEGYALFGFRPRVYPSVTGRPRTAPLIDAEQSIFIENRDIDFAGRWSHQLGPIDIALSHFIGTSREPIFAVSVSTGSPILVPIYDDILQSGLELQWIIDALILKFEGIRRIGTDSVRNDFLAISTGFEYEFSGCFGMDCSFRWITEYLGNDRDSTATGIFQRDLFIGSNLRFNNTFRTEITGGFVVDLEDTTSFGTLSFETGLWEGFRLKGSALKFFYVAKNDPLKPLELDDHLQIDLTYTFSF